MSKKVIASSLTTLIIINSNSLNQVTMHIEGKNSKTNHLPLTDSNGYLSIILIKWMVIQKLQEIKIIIRLIKR